MGFGCFHSGLRQPSIEVKQIHVTCVGYRGDLSVVAVAFSIVQDNEGGIPLGLLQLLL